MIMFLKKLNTNTPWGHLNSNSFYFISYSSGLLRIEIKLLRIDAELLRIDIKLPRTDIELVRIDIKFLRIDIEWCLYKPFKVLKDNWYSSFSKSWNWQSRGLLMSSKRSETVACFLVCYTVLVPWWKLWFIHFHYRLAFSFVK